MTSPCALDCSCESCDQEFLLWLNETMDKLDEGKQGSRVA